MTPAQRSRCMSRIKGRDTKLELALRSALWQRGLRYRVRSSPPGKPDIVFTRQRIAVFVDGCFWQGCPVHGTKPKTNAVFWEEKLRRNMERDSSTTAKLEHDVWIVMRFWVVSQ